MGVNSLLKTVTRQRRDCDLNPGPSAPESSTLTTRLPSNPPPGNLPLRKSPSATSTALYPDLTLNHKFPTVIVPTLLLSLFSRSRRPSSSDHGIDAASSLLHSGAGGRYGSTGGRYQRDRRTDGHPTPAALEAGSVNNRPLAYNANHG